MRIYEAGRSAALDEQLLALSAAWEAEDSCWGYRRNTSADLDGDRIVVAEDERGVLAYLLGHTERAERSSSVMPEGTVYFELAELYVRPELRCQGLGRALFSHVEDVLRREKLPLLLLTAAAKNHRSILHFYLDELGMEFWSARLFKRLTKEE